MNKTDGSFGNEGVSVDTIAAAIGVAMMLGLITILGVNLGSNTALDFNDPTAQGKSHSLFWSSTRVKQALPKTDRAKDFSRSVKSERYWKELHASVAKPKPPVQSKKGRKLPPIVIGTKD